LSPEVQKKHKL